MTKKTDTQETVVDETIETTETAKVSDRLVRKFAIGLGVVVAVATAASMIVYLSQEQIEATTIEDN